MEDFSLFISKDSNNQPQAPPVLPEELSPTDHKSPDRELSSSTHEHVFDELRSPETNIMTHDTPDHQGSVRSRTSSTAETFSGHLALTEVEEFANVSESLQVERSVVPKVPSNTPHEGFLSPKQSLLKTHIHGNQMSSLLWDSYTVDRLSQNSFKRRRNVVLLLLSHTAWMKLIVIIVVICTWKYLCI